jgi:hypothetical protein
MVSRSTTGAARSLCVASRSHHKNVGRAEPHGYEAHGIGKKEFKRKRFLD